ncbi:MAG: dienelactone hydrolase family protein [Luteolibacter sp.]
MMNTTLSNLRQIEVRIPCSDAELDGDLVIPAGANGVVLFAHGSGSSRLSPRNRMVADEMHKHGLATLLFDLLTPLEAAEESATGVLRFNIPFLTERLKAATRWAQNEESLENLGIGYFGASTGAAAALTASADVPEVQAVVSRGGRTDLAGDAVERVQAATLLIVGELDQPVIEWNNATYDRLPEIRHLAVIDGASHLFQETGTLEHVAKLAASWFEAYLTKFPSPRGHP